MKTTDDVKPQLVVDVLNKIGLSERPEVHLESIFNFDDQPNLNEILSLFLTMRINPEYIQNNCRKIDITLLLQVINNHLVNNAVNYEGPREYLYMSFIYISLLLTKHKNAFLFSTVFDYLNTKKFRDNDEEFRHKFLAHYSTVATKINLQSLLREEFFTYLESKLDYIFLDENLALFAAKIREVIPTVLNEFKVYDSLLLEKDKQLVSVSV